MSPPAPESPGNAARLRFERLVLAMLLPLVAGIVNAVGFLELGSFTSHMTGNTTKIGDDLANHDWEAASDALAMLGAFCFGALFSTLSVERAQRRDKARFFQPLLWELAALSVFAVERDNHPLSWQPFWIKELLCFAMGLQNALVTTMSDAVIRTTHLTGLLTDLSIEVGRLLSWSWDWWVNGVRPAAAPQGFWRALGQERDMRKLRLHAMVVGSFLLGAFIGPHLYRHLDNGAFIVPCTILAGLLIFDLLLGMRRKVSYPT